jgi:predicted MFS family arabinose efflux permease
VRAERIGPKRALSAALVCLGAGLVVLAFAESRTHVIAAAVLCGVGHGWAFPILLGLVIARCRANERGAALAIYTALFDAGTLVGGPVLGAVIETRGYTAMFLVAAGLVLLGLVVLQVADRRAPGR